MEETELDKSEQATPHKLQRAREKGAVARSTDLGFLAALVAAIMFFATSGLTLAIAIGRISAETLAAAGQLGGNPAALGIITGRLADVALKPLTMFAGGLFGVALALDFLQVGPVFSFAALKPDFSRLNPAAGFRRLLTLRMLVEALKATIKLALYALVAWLVIGGVLDADRVALADGGSVGRQMMHHGLRLLFWFALPALAFAVLDQVYVRRQFAKRMRMSRREVKRETRDREGEPRQKQRRKQLHGEFASAVKALREVRGSDVIIVNPTHIAVALRYDPATMDAPQITARGRGDLAVRIKRMAFLHSILVISDAPLARALYRFGRLDSAIPANFYAAVADHYRRHKLGGKTT